MTDTHQPGRLIGVGVGPGDPEHLTLKAVRVLRDADHVFAPHGGRAAAIVAEHATVAPLEFAMSDAGARDASWDRAGAAIAPLVAAGQTVAFATLGDPNLFSTFTYVAATVRELVPGVVVETVPGITAMQDLAARTDTVLAEGAESLALVPYTAGDDVLRAALDASDTVVVYKGGRHLPAVLDAVRDAGALDRAVYGEQLGRADEATGAAATRDGSAPYMSTVIVPGARAGRGAGIR